DQFPSSSENLLDSSLCQNLAPASLCVFPGPTSPSPTEIKLSELFDCPLYTCTSLSPAYSALQSGLDCSVFARAGSSASTDTFKTMCTILKSAVIHSESPVRSAWQYDVPLLRYRQSVQEKAALVNAAAAEIKGAILTGIDQVEIVLVIDSPLLSIVSDIACIPIII
ncbi:hypothetical protein BVRB_037840, partial [Beta vulgaris subsp. vulgaris]